MCVSKKTSPVELLNAIENDEDFMQYVMFVIETELQKSISELLNEIEEEEKLMLYGTGENPPIGIIKA